MREMKNSGIEWIGKIPKDWKIIKLKYIGKYINGYAFKPIDWEDRGLPIIRIQDLTKSNEKPNYYNGKLDEKYYIKNGDILVSWAATLNAFVWNNGNGWLNQHIFKVIPNSTIIDKKFCYWLLKLAMQHLNNDNKHGIVMQHVTLDVFNNFEMPIGSVREQDKISNYLNKKIIKIDNIIKKTSESIEDYKLFKQSMITKVVTKGLNQKTKMKDSGIDFIGKIPKHWNIKTIRYLGKCQNGISKSSDYFGEYDYPFVNYGDVYNNYELPRNYSNFVNSSESDRKLYSVEYGDVFFTRTSETIEEIGLSATCLEDVKAAVFSGFLIRFRPNNINELYPEYSKFYFRSDIHRKFFVKEMNIVTRASLGQDLLKKLPVILPSIEEQKEIANFLNKKCGEIEDVIKQKEKLIEELESYKKSLIYECVTGKKEVSIEMNYSAEDVSNWILNKNLENRNSGKEVDGITNLKLQKLLYYASGIYYFYKKCNLIKEDFVAWKHGPVIKHIYYKYNSNGAKEIQHNRKITIGIDSETQEILEKMYSKYSKYTAEELRNMTHQESPWKKTNRNKIIEKDLIKDYFENKYKWEQ